MVSRLVPTRRVGPKQKNGVFFQWLSLGQNNRSVRPRLCRRPDKGDTTCRLPLLATRIPRRTMAAVTPRATFVRFVAMILSPCISEMTGRTVNRSAVLVEIDRALARIYANSARIICTVVADIDLYSLVPRFRGQRLTENPVFDSRLRFGGSLGRTDRSVGRGVGADRAAPSI